MHCPKCGREIDESMKFCPECGETINGEIFGQDIDETDFVLEEEIYFKPKNNVSYLLNEDEYYIESINTHWDENDGVLFLTTQRLFFVNLDEELLWGCYLDDIIDNKLEVDGNNQILKIHNKKGLFNCIVALSSMEDSGHFKELLERSIKGDIKLADSEFQNSTFEKENLLNKIEYNDELSTDEVDSDSDYVEKKSPVTYVIIGLIIVAFICVVGYVLKNNWTKDNRWETTRTVNKKDSEGESDEKEYTSKNALVASSSYEAEQIARNIFEEGYGINQQDDNYYDEIITCQCVLTPKDNPYGGYVVQVVLMNGYTRYVKFDRDGLFSGIGTEILK